MVRSRESPPLRLAFGRRAVAGKLCVRDAQMRNGVYVPTPHVMALSQVSWLVSCASGTHRCPTVSTFPRHIITSPEIVMLYLIFVGYLHLEHYNVMCNCMLHTPQA